MKTSNIILAVIAVALIGIFGFMALEQDSPSEEFAENVGEATEEVGDEIDDATTN